MTAMMHDALVDFAAEIQRVEIECALRRMRAGRQIEEMKFCPACFPALFDAALEFTPNPVFCRTHAAHALAQVFIEVRHDASGWSRPVAVESEEVKCA